MKPVRELDLDGVITWPVCAVCGEVPWCDNPYSTDCGYQIDSRPVRSITEGGDIYGLREDATTEGTDPQ
jgi:hypothetical protein